MNGNYGVLAWVFVLAGAGVMGWAVWMMVVGWIDQSRADRDAKARRDAMPDYRYEDDD